MTATRPVTAKEADRWQSFLAVVLANFDARRREARAAQTAIIEAARAFCYRVHHQRPARLADGRIRTTIQGDKGWPDLVIAGHGRCWAIELKRPGNPPSPEQVAWITALCAAGIDARVLIVPTSQQAFIDEMQRAKDTR